MAGDFLPSGLESASGKCAEYHSFCADRHTAFSIIQEDYMEIRADHWTCNIRVNRGKPADSLPRTLRMGRYDSQYTWMCTGASGSKPVVSEKMWKKGKIKRVLGAAVCL